MDNYVTMKTRLQRKMRNRYEDMIPSCHLIFVSNKNEKRKKSMQRQNLHRDTSRYLRWQNNSDYFLPIYGFLQLSNFFYNEHNSFPVRPKKLKINEIPIRTH